MIKTGQILKEHLSRTCDREAFEDLQSKFNDMMADKSKSTRFFNQLRRSIHFVSFSDYLIDLCVIWARSRVEKFNGLNAEINRGTFVEETYAVHGINLDDEFSFFHVFDLAQINGMLLSSPDRVQYMADDLHESIPNTFDLERDFREEHQMEPDSPTPEPAPSGATETAEEDE